MLLGDLPQKITISDCSKSMATIDSPAFFSQKQTASLYEV